MSRGHFLVPIPQPKGALLERGVSNDRMAVRAVRYVRGAEFWEVNDAIMKMILTGLLICKIGLLLFCSFGFFSWLSYVASLTIAFSRTRKLYCLSLFSFTNNITHPLTRQTCRRRTCRRRRAQAWPRSYAWSQSQTSTFLNRTRIAFSASEDAKVENVVIGVVLVAMDVTFIVTSVISMILAFCP